MSNLNDTTQQPKVEIAVRNFGPIPAGTVDLRPLTVFLGPSNTGKTYFATLVYALHGVFAGNAASPAAAVLGANIKTELTKCFDLDSLSALRRVTHEKPHAMTISLKMQNGTEDGWCIKMTASDKSVNVVGAPSSLKWGEGNRYYLPATRSGLMQRHGLILNSLAGKTGRFPGIPTLSAELAEFLQRIMVKKVGNGNPLTPIADALESDVLGGEILAKLSPTGYPDFHYLPKGMKKGIRLSQAASMVSELAPLVLSLRRGIVPGDLLIIEEPEAHLHLDAQAAMAVTLARIVRTGVKVIVTTHSEWLLDELANLMLEGLLAHTEDKPASWLLPAEVGAWQFQTDAPIKEIPFDVIQGVYPPAYDILTDALYNRAVNLQDRFTNREGSFSHESA